MFLTKKYLPRRTFLRGVGTAVALPLLDAMVPAGTALAQTAAKPAPHLGFIYFPHGAIMDQWTPAGEGANFELSPILKPLAGFRKQLTVVSGLGNRPAVSPAVHAITPGTWLSCVHPRASQDPYGGPTVDQIAARHIGQDTPLPSIEVSVEGRGGGGSCDRDFGCSYSGTISFRTPTTPLPMENDPRKLFQNLFGEGDTAEERKRIQHQYSSVLDLVSEQAADLRRSLGPQDRAMLGDYLDSVREIERRVKKMEAHDLSHVEVPNAPAATPPAFEQHINLMFDLVGLAYQANMTRIFSFMMAAEVSNLTYNQIGVPDAFHPLSHHNNDPAKMEKLVKIQNYHTKIFARFLEKLQNMPDGDGSMLDHSIILYGSNMSNSNLHNHDPLPHAVVGGWNKLKGDQHLKYPDHTPLANLLLTILDRAGVPMDKIGDSTGTFKAV
jgi:hypothetical protein